MHRIFSPLQPLVGPSGPVFPCSAVSYSLINVQDPCTCTAAPTCFVEFFFFSSESTVAKIFLRFSSLSCNTIRRVIQNFKCSVLYDVFAIRCCSLSSAAFRLLHSTNRWNARGHKIRSLWFCRFVSVLLQICPSNTKHLYELLYDRVVRGISNFMTLWPGR